MSSAAGSLDTNVVLRLILEDLPEQHRAVRALIDQEAGQLLVADAAVIEVIFVLTRHYRFTRREIHEIVGGLVELPKIQANRSLIKRALAIFIKHPKLSFEDCYLAVLAEANEALPLWTFDEKLAKQVPTARLVPVKP